MRDLERKMGIFSNTNMHEKRFESSAHIKNEIFAQKKDRMIRSFQIYKKICSEGNHDILK